MKLPLWRMARLLAEGACGVGVQAQFLETPEQAAGWLASCVRVTRSC
jgi:hypothetical protein